MKFAKLSLALAAASVALFAGCGTSPTYKEAETILCGCQATEPTIASKAKEGCDLIQKATLIYNLLPQAQKDQAEAVCVTAVSEEVELACSGFDFSTLTNINTSTATEETTSTESTTSTEATTSTDTVTEPTSTETATTSESTTSTETGTSTGTSDASSTGTATDGSTETTTATESSAG